MKTLILILSCVAYCFTANAQGTKFKKIERISDDSINVQAPEGSILIDGSVTLRSGNARIDSTYIPGVFRLPDVARIDSNIVLIKHKDGTPNYIEKKRTGLRAAQMLSPRELTDDFFKETEILNIPNPEEQIDILNVEIDAAGINHIKGQQVFDGVPIYDTQFTLHVSNTDERFLGRTVNRVFIDSTAAKISGQEAVDIALQDLKNETTVRELSDFEKKIMNYDQPTVEPIYYPGVFKRFHYTYKISIRPNFLEEWIYYVDAVSGKIVEKYNNTKTDGPATATASDIKGRLRTVQTYLENGTYYLANIAESMFDATNFTGMVATYDAGYTNPYLSNFNSTMVTSSNNQWNNPSAISVHYAATETFRYLKNTFNRNSYDDKGGNIICIVNVGNDNGSRGYDNAFWNGKASFFGTGSSFSPLVAMDIVAHEFGHGVVQTTAALEYQYQSGAINESYADIFGAMVDRSNWAVGEEVIQDRQAYPSGFMRDMANPHNGGSSGWQPAHTSEMYIGEDDLGGVHINNSLGNHAFYTYATSTSKEKAEQVFYHALTKYLTATSKFIDFRIAVVQSAKDLYGDADAELVGKAFDKVGITEDSGSATKQDYPVNPGTEYLLLYNLNPYITSTLHRTADGRTFEPLTTVQMISKPSVTDNGAVAVFVNSGRQLCAINLNTKQVQTLLSDAIFSNAVISKDGNRLAALTYSPDAKIHVYDFISGKWAAFQLYNPTTGYGNPTSGGVQFAEALEFDHTGEYILYDAYNVIPSQTTGRQIDYWDIGLIHVWDKQTATFGSGQIAKPFSNVGEGASIGNPTFAKNSPNIIAFDYMDIQGNYATFGANLQTGTTNALFMNNMPSFPSYGIADDCLTFTVNDVINGYGVSVGIHPLGADKITPSTTQQPFMIASTATWGVLYGNGARILGLKPVPAFSADIRSGGAPLEVQYLDLSENKPTYWNWEFEGGAPVAAVTQNPIVYYNSPGTYKVKLTVSNEYGNDVIEKQSYITVTTTDIEAAKQENILVYPNPATDFVWIQGAECNVNEIKLYDITGKTIVVPAAEDDNKLRMDVSGLNAGFYFLKSNGKNVKIIKK